MIDYTLEKVCFNSDSVSIKAHLYLPLLKGKIPVVLVVHGLTGRKENHREFAIMLTKRGIAAFVIDLRGHGESEGVLNKHVLADVRGCDTNLWVSYRQRSAILPKIFPSIA